MSSRLRIAILATVLLLAAFFVVFAEESDCGDDGEDEPEVVVDGVRYYYVNSATLGECAYLGGLHKDTTQITDFVVPDKVTFPGIGTVRVKWIGDFAFQKQTGRINGTVDLGSVEHIGSGAFDECKSITTVKYSGEAKLSIGGMAFKDSSIESISISASELTINQWAFENCVSLTNVYAPYLKLVDNWSFKGCTSLEKIVMDPTTISEESFMGCEKLKSIDCDNLETVLKSAFSGCKNLIEVLSTKEIDIGIESFLNCQSLKSITKVKRLDESSFSGCAKLADFDFSVVSGEIPKNCFYGCAELVTVSLPNSVTSIDEGAFSGCSALETFVASSTNITKLLGHTFEGCIRLEKVEVKSLASIGESDFFGCKSLETIDFGTITSIGKSAFEGCSSMSDFSFLSGITEIPERCFANTGVELYRFSSVKKICDYAFFGCGSLEIVVSLGGVKTIGISAFESCESLSALLASDESFCSDITIGANAFKNCMNLEWSQIAFAGPRTLGDGSFDIGIGKTIYVLKNGDESDVEMKNARGSAYFSYIGKIGDISYSFCPGSGIIRIGGTGMLDVNPDDLPWHADKESLKKLTIATGITGIGDGIFADVKLEGMLAFPETLTVIGDSAFENCSSLTFIEIGNQLNSIGAKAFYNCPGISGHIVFKNVQTIGESAFEGCSNLTGVTISGNTIIGKNSFKGCVCIHDITFGDGIAEIGESAFEGCIGLNLQVIEFMGCPSVIGENAFSFGTIDNRVNVLCIIPSDMDTSVLEEKCGEYTDLVFNLGKCGDNCSYYYILSACSLTIKGTGKIYDYSLENPAPWNDFRLMIKKINISDEITRIGNYAFHGCEDLEDIVFPFTNGEIVIGSNAFSGCTSLKKVKAAPVTTIESYAFANCSSLSGTLDFGNVETIGDCAFVNCHMLTGIIMGHVKTIGERAFMSCGLKGDLTIFKSTVSIGMYAFYGCSGMDNGRIIFEGGPVELGLLSFALGNPKQPDIHVTVQSNGWANEKSFSTDVFGYTIPKFVSTTHDVEESGNIPLYAMAAIIIAVFVAAFILLWKMGIISFKREKKKETKKGAGEK